jgi:CRP-like cAMP-binding protein
MNRILAALEGEERDALVRRAQTEHFDAGTVLHEPGLPLERAYFPEDAIVAYSVRQDGGSAAATGLVGREGVASPTALLGDGIPYERATVQTAGRMSTLPVAEVRRAIGRSAELRRLIAFYAQAYTAQAAQSIACSASHATESRLSTWLLSCVDRGRAAARIPLDAAKLSALLGIGRPTLTVVLGTLQTAGLIRTGPDLVAIVDREGLEEASCECYGRLRTVFERLLPSTYR